MEFAVRPSGDVPARDFLNGETAETQAKFLVLFQAMANLGWLSPKRFKKEMDDLWAFRHEVQNRQLRFSCFQDGNRWIVTHGFVKPGAQKGKGKWPQSEVTRARRIRDEYLSRKTSGEAT